MIKTVAVGKEAFFYVSLLVGTALISLSAEHSNPLGAFLGVLLTLKAVQVLGERGTIPIVLSLFLTHVAKEILNSDTPGVKWWVYLALGIAALAKDWRRQMGREN